MPLRIKNDMRVLTVILCVIAIVALLIVRNYGVDDDDFDSIG